MTNSLQHRSEILQDRFGLKVAARLSAGTNELPHDVSERLRAARVQAMAKRKVVRMQTAGGVNSAGGSTATLNFGDEGLNLWGRIGAALPLIALVVGLITIYTVQNDNRANELAEVDAALLADDLPPAAYADPGFLQFLKAGRATPPSNP